MYTKVRLPKWFAANCISIPSCESEKGGAITPALLLPGQGGQRQTTQIQELFVYVQMKKERQKGVCGALLFATRRIKVFEMEFYTAIE